MAVVKVCTADDISLDEYAAMQRESFQDLLAEMKVSDDFISAAFFRWKYNPPFGKAKLVLGLDDDKMLAATMIYPMVLRDGDRRIIAWQNGDTATVPAARKIGLYPRCMKQAVRLVENDELIFGFPNKNSVRGFSFFVKTDKGVVPLLAKFAPIRFKPFGETISEVHSFEGVDIDYDALLQSPLPVFEKTSAYLDWRYAKHPIHSYSMFVSKNSQNRADGYVVTRNADIQGRHVMLVMELLGKNRHIESRLLRHAIAMSSKGSFVMMFSSMYSKLEAFRLGMMKVPERFVPKRQVLFASGKGALAQSALEKPWRLQMGDWDGF